MLFFQGAAVVHLGSMLGGTVPDLSPCSISSWRSSGVVVVVPGMQPGVVTATAGMCSGLGARATAFELGNVVGACVITRECSLAPHAHSEASPTTISVPHLGLIHRTIEWT